MLFDKFTDRDIASTSTMNPPPRLPLTELNDASAMARGIIELMTLELTLNGYRPVIHFELEGGFKMPPGVDPRQLNFSLINQELKALHILGELKEEYWPGQWEYVSLFEGQNPLREADDLHRAMQVLPGLCQQAGAREAWIKPVLWSADAGRLAPGCSNVFDLSTNSVHIPNAVQINISLLNQQGENCVPYQHFGERLQRHFLESSRDCTLIYLPEQEAFERLALRKHYGLDAELSSPFDISGGHQGSIALYKELGKHNQKMGAKTLLVDHLERPVVEDYDWHQTARVEHRLGASSARYNPWFNTVFALANLTDALQEHLKAQQVSDNQWPGYEGENYPSLPTALYQTDEQPGAFELFCESTWLPTSITRSIHQLTQFEAGIEFLNITGISSNYGEKFKQSIIETYRKSVIFEL